ncbi:hypothetical protein TNCV_3994971 [Trichonephila clavipes]|nr:hypothetical protein TNCV_3994971 [Trichonephila clavipes]
MGKAVDLTDLDKGQIVTTRCLETASKMERLMDSLRAAVVSTYRKWCIDGHDKLRVNDLLAMAHIFQTLFTVTEGLQRPI